MLKYSTFVNYSLQDFKNVFVLVATIEFKEAEDIFLFADIFKRMHLAWYEKLTVIGQPYD